MKKHIRKISIAVAAIIAIAIGALVGCGGDVSVSLTADSITLYVGESRDIAPYIVFDPMMTENIDISLQTDSECINVSGTRVTGMQTGEAELRVKVLDKTLKLNAQVIHRPASIVEVQCDSLVQTVKVGDPVEPVIFTAVTDGAEEDIEWTAAGQSFTGDTFEFTPDGYGEFEVSLRCGGITGGFTVGVYRPTSVEVRCDGALEQSGSFSSVVFTAVERIDTRNPRSVYEWRVNGKTASNSSVFDFMPTAEGEYEIGLSVNGKVVNTDGMTVKAVGINSPSAHLEYDDAGGVFAILDNNADIAFVSVIAPDGGRVTLDSTDAQHSHLFERGRIKLTEYIDPFSDTPGMYTVIIGGEGRCELKFESLSETAELYADKKVLCRNCLITSARDAELWVRENYACGIKNSPCFVATDIGEATTAMRDTAAELGMACKVSEKNGIVTVDFGEYTNAPTIGERSDAYIPYVELPHIEYVAERRRPTGYVFMSDRCKRSVSVSNSEQLLYAVLNGYKPEVERGSVAARIYRLARNIMQSIIGYDYSDRDKAHAVYDWLQWATVNTTSAPKKSSDYLESVFGSTLFAQAEGRRASVTSLGAAKLFAFMCGIEGIPCEIVRGENAYYYNRVSLDGSLYNVDVYGGKSDGGTSHRGLFLTDACLDGLLGVDGTDGGAYDEYTAFMQKYTYHGEYFDYYIEQTEIDYPHIKAAVYHALDSAVTGDVVFPLIGSTEMYYISAAGAEFRLADGVNADSVSSFIARAAKEYLYETYEINSANISVTVKYGTIRLSVPVPAASDDDA